MQRRYGRTTDATVGELLGFLVEDILGSTSFRKVVAVSGAEDDFTVRGVEVTAEELDAFANGCEEGELPMQPATVDGASGRGCFPLRRPSSWEACVWVPAPRGESGFVTGVLVEGDRADPDIDVVRAAVRAAAPLLANAQVHALRLELRELREQGLVARDALDTLPDPVLVMDGESRILLSNARADELLVVRSEDSSSGRRHAVERNNLFFSAYRARASLDTTGRRGTGELLLVDPTDGSDVNLEVFVRRIQGRDDGDEDTIFVLRDITDLSRATNELEIQVSRSIGTEHRARRESERLNIVIENAGVPILVTNRDTDITLLNMEAERLLEVDRSGLHALSRTEGTPGNTEGTPGNVVRLAGLLNAFLLQPAVRQMRQITLFDPEDGRAFPVSALSTKILDEFDQPTAVVTVLHDLTQEVEIRELAQKLQRLNVELEGRVTAATKELAARNIELEEQRAQLVHASRMKSQFLATMSHELRTPINAIIGYNSLVRDGVFGSLTEKQAASLDRMRRAADHLLLLINDILDLSRIEAGKTSFHATDVDVRSSLDKLAESVRPMAEEKGLDFIVDIDPEVNTIRTDETRLGQVLLNLLSNAVKFTRTGSVRLHARPAGRGDGLCLEVIDTGIGIKRVNLEAIFDEFTQVDQSETREQGGTGLGLAISRKLTWLMGGSLSVSSAPGTGTTFSVVLPPAPPAAWADSDDGARPAD